MGRNYGNSVSARRVPCLLPIALVSSKGRRALKGP